MTAKEPLTNIAEKLLKWYQKNARQLAWRTPPQKTKQRLPNPYPILLSEIMLQQTQVDTVQPYFQKFLAKWPTLQSFAEAEIDPILLEWAGLGYYRRAHHLHQCTKAVLANHAGNIPSNLNELLALPGIGAYTAAAIRAIAFDEKAHVIDGNIERIYTRLICYPKCFPKKTSKRDAFSEPFMPSHSFGNYAQALMDLGATICTPKKPKCPICPIKTQCKAFKTGTQLDFPKKMKKKKIPTKYGTLYWHQNSKNELLIEKRPMNEMLGGLYGFPTSKWEVSNQIKQVAIKHSFTHFHLHLEIKKEAPADMKAAFYIPIKKLKNYALPTLMQKAVALMKNHIDV